MRNSLLLTGALLANASVMAAEQKQPNIVVIFCDDLGYGDIGCYGHPTIRTPRLDQMAHEGMRLTQFYVGASVSTPSRGALLTGRMPIRNGTNYVYFPDDKGGLNPWEITLAEQLGSAGYKTGIFGKWHLGHKPEYLPLAQGFDEYFGIPYSNDMNPPANVYRNTELVPLSLYDGDKIIENSPDQSQFTQRFTNKAIEFIKENKENPFFVYLAQPMPHHPLSASEAFLGKSKRGLYGDVVEELDFNVGRLLDTLREEGLDQNTLVIFTSDNGPWLSMNQEGGTGGILHEGKATSWEGGHRSACIMWGPALVKPGTISMGVFSSLDFFPTFSHMAGIELPKDRIYDGVDILPLLQDEYFEVDRALPYYWNEKLHAIRRGSYKLRVRYVNDPYRTGFKDHAWETPRLYNLDVDPTEQYNIADKHPEIVEALLKDIEEHKASLKK